METARWEKVAAQVLKEAGADVNSDNTPVQKLYGNIPFGCKRINYGERMDYLPKCDLVVSATASPNFTLREELFEQIKLQKTLILIDLAVPRDIEPEIGRMKESPFNLMDSFHTDEIPAELQEHLTAAGTIVQAHMDEFYQWFDGRDVIPRIQEIKEDAVQDLNLRIMKILKNTPMEEIDRERLLKAVDDGCREGGK